MPKRMAAKPTVPACRNSTANYTKKREALKKVPDSAPSSVNKLKPQRLKGKSSICQSSQPITNKPMPPLQGSVAKRRSTTSISESKCKFSNSLIDKENHSLGNRTAKQINPEANDRHRANFDAEGRKGICYSKVINVYH